jgi:hypothetical protein
MSREGGDSTKTPPTNPFEHPASKLPSSAEARRALNSLAFPQFYGGRNRQFQPCLPKLPALPDVSELYRSRGLSQYRSAERKLFIGKRLCKNESPRRKINATIGRLVTVSRHLCISGLFCWQIADP